jgi:DNA polymerase-3 subunit delta'
VLSEIVGQEAGVSCLRKVVGGTLSAPLLLVGEEGVGRKASVLAAIREIISTSRGEGSSEVFQLEHGVHPDVLILAAPEGKELGVDAVRDAIASSNQHPAASPFRFFILDGADRLTPAAANAILKTLEEPSHFSRFFLLAESYDRVITTIRSRCGRVDYRKLPESFVVQRLSKFEKDPDKALVYARLSEGSIGRATRYWGSNRIVTRDKSLEILRQAATGDLPAAFGLVDELSKDLQFVLRCMVSVVHDLLLVSTVPGKVINRDVMEELVEIAAKAPSQRWVAAWRDLRTVWVRNESSYVNLSLQIKAALVASFIGV